MNLLCPLTFDALILRLPLKYMGSLGGWGLLTCFRQLVDQGSLVLLLQFGV